MIKLKNVLYSVSLIVVVLISIFYGQTFVSNVGNFEVLSPFGNKMSFASFIYIPIVYFSLVIIISLIANKNFPIFNKRSFMLYVFLFFIFGTYVGILIFLKDYSYLLGSKDDVTSLTTNEKIQAFFNFLMALTNIYIVFFLLKYNKQTKYVFAILFLAIGLFALSSIIYSLINEFDVYKSFNFNFLFNKWDGSSLKQALSFFKIGNVYGHALVIGIFSIICLSLLLDKLYIGLFSLILAFFVPFSMSRAAILATLIFYYLYLFIVFYKLFKKNKVMIVVITIIMLFIPVLLYLDGTSYYFLKINLNNKTYYPSDFIKHLFTSWEDSRFNFLGPILKNMQIIDYIFGIGYGNGFIVTRSYNFVFYYHNTVIEYISTGGIFYLIFITVLVGICFYKDFKVIKINFTYFYFLICLSITMIIYGMFESFPLFQNDFPGIAYGAFFSLVPILKYFELKNLDNNIVTLNPLKK